MMILSIYGYESGSRLFLSYDPTSFLSSYEAFVGEYFPACWQVLSHLLASTLQSAGDTSPTNGFILGLPLYVPIVPIAV